MASVINKNCASLRSFYLGDYALFLERTDCLRADLHPDLLTVDNDCLHLKVWLPDFLCAVQREGHIVSVLLAFTC